MGLGALQETNGDECTSKPTWKEESRQETTKRLLFMPPFEAQSELHAISLHQSF
jgi:hypothetical protein